MTFRGVFESPELLVAPCGLLSVATVTDHKSVSEEDESWVRGFDYMYDSYATIRLLTTNDDSVTGGELSTHGTNPMYSRYYPFFIEAEIARSTFNVLAADMFDKVLKQLEAVTQKAVETELWSGKAALAATNANLFITKSGSSVLAPNNAGHVPAEALAHLEIALAGNPLGASGIIHMTRDVASALGDRLLYFPKSGSEIGKVVTRLGTPVSIGSGYDGSGPINETNKAASATNKWMFATGPIGVILGKSIVVNESLSQGLDPTKNDSIIKATRPAAAYFDPSTLFSTRVTLPAV